MKKWIEVEGKKMDSVEFARFIREKTTPEVEKMLDKAVMEEADNKLRLKRLQELN